VGGIRQPQRASSQGLIAVSVPPLAGDVALWLEDTPVRYLAWAVTALGLIMLFILGRRRTWVNAANEPIKSATSRAYSLLSAQEVITLVVVLVMYVALVMLVNLLPTLLSPL